VFSQNQHLHELTEAGVMRRRFELTEAQFERFAPHWPGKAGDQGFQAKNNDVFLQGVLWILRTGAPWRDLPERDGNWGSIWRRFRRWSLQGTWSKLFEQMQDPDYEWLLMDSTRIRVHPDAAGGPLGPAEEEIGRSRGGKTTKIHAVVDALGNPVRLILSDGPAADVNYGEPLLENLTADAVIADQAYDSDKLIDTIQSIPAEVVIPPKKNRTEQRADDPILYKLRSMVEGFFQKLKQGRRIATRLKNQRKVSPGGSTWAY
jgi:transposase